MRVLITGTDRGVGADLRDRFIAKGHAVFAWAGRRGGDICDPKDVAAVLEGSPFGDPELLVNVAGVAKMRYALMQPIEEAREMCLTNLFGTWLISREVGRRMIPNRRGAIVNIGSIYARQCPAGGAMYAATKAGIEAMTTCMAKEFGPFGITVNCLALSPYDTEAMRATGTPEQIAKTVASLTPPRLLTIDDIFSAIIGLTGNPTVTGQTLYLGGVR